MSASSPASRIEHVIHEALGWLKPHIAEFPWADKWTYADWLAQTYFYVHHSTRLLASAAARLPIDERGDALHHRFASHMGEEKKHEKLCLHDLKMLGALIDNLPERASTRLFYEPQYYKVEHKDPTALFGYILVLEALGAVGDGRAILDKLARAHGDRCLSFVKLHVEDDPDHLKKAFGIVEGCGEPQLGLIEENVWQTVHAYAGLLREIRTACVSVR
jgi:hypothetical protein